MNTDLAALASQLDADPRDPLAIQALADWIEERGGEAAPVRSLLVGDGDVLVIGFPADLPTEARQRYSTLRETLQQWLADHGRDVLVLTMHADVTLRHIRTERQREGS